MLGVSSAALPASLRRTNQRTVLSLLLRLGSASRADLAKAAGLSQPTAGKIIEELKTLGMVQVSSEQGGGRRLTRGRRLGRPGQMLKLNSERPRFVGIELGVRETRVATLPVGVGLTDHWSLRFTTPATPEKWLQRLRRVSEGITTGGLWGVLVSVPGIVDETAGKSLFSPNLHWLEHTDLPGLLRPQWDLPVLLVQEIRALALGQLTAEPELEDFLLVDFGEGVGGAIVLDGKLYSHPTAMAGELGHTPVPGNLRQCGCGGQGCLETLVSERGLLESFAKTAPGRPPQWESLLEDVRAHGMEPWLTQTLDMTAKVIVGALNILGLHRVLVTGRLSEFPQQVTERLVAQIQEQALWSRFGEVSCRTAARRRGAGLVAAGLDRLVLPQHDELNLAGSRRAVGARDRMGAGGSIRCGGK